MKTNKTARFSKEKLTLTWAEASTSRVYFLAEGCGSAAYFVTKAKSGAFAAWEVHPSPVRKGKTAKARLIGEWRRMADAQLAALRTCHADVYGDHETRGLTLKKAARFMYFFAASSRSRTWGGAEEAQEEARFRLHGEA